MGAQWGEAALSSSEVGEQESNRRELGKNRNRDNIFLRVVRTRMTSERTIVMRRRRKTTTTRKSLGTGSVIASL